MVLMVVIMIMDFSVPSIWKEYLRVNNLGLNAKIWLY
jgi:competence protein ComGC